MKLVTREWIEKAEGDYRTALRESRVKRGPNHDAVCFHAQQCAEKYLKALLTEHGIHFPKTHDLLALVQLAGDDELGSGGIAGQFDLLSRYPVAFRYPGASATQEEVGEAMKALGEVRSLLRERLGTAGPQG